MPTSDDTMIGRKVVGGEVACGEVEKWLGQAGTGRRALVLYMYILACDVVLCMLLFVHFLF